MSFKLYLALLGTGDPSKDPLDVYFKTKKIFSPIDQTTQDFISEKLDLAFQVSCPAPWRTCTFIRLS
jgi:hypothetical protein